MIKESVLLPRVLYSGCFTILGLYVTFSSPWYPVSFLGAFLILFVVSFMWQYYVLHVVLKAMTTRQQLWIVVGVWMLFATMVGAWGLDALADFDWSQDRSTLVEDLSWRLMTYIVGASAFIGGACAWCAFAKRNTS